MIFPVTSIGFVITVSAHRLGRCMSPLTVSWFSFKRATMVVIGVWLFSLLVPIALLFKDALIVYDPIVTYCQPFNVLDTTEILYKQHLYVWTPFTIIVLLNAAIMIQAKVSAQRLSLVAVRTVCGVCGLFLISWTIPMTIIILHIIYPDKRFYYLTRVSLYVMTFAALFNPFLYTMTNIKFKIFVIRKLRKMLCFKRQAWTRNNNVVIFINNSRTEGSRVRIERARRPHRNSI